MQYSTPNWPRARASSEGPVSSLLLECGLPISSNPLSSSPRMQRLCSILRDSTCASKKFLPCCAYLFYFCHLIPLLSCLLSTLLHLLAAFSQGRVSFISSGPSIPARRSMIHASIPSSRYASRALFPSNRRKPPSKMEPSPGSRSARASPRHPAPPPLIVLASISDGCIAGPIAAAAAPVLSLCAGLHL